MSVSSTILSEIASHVVTRSVSDLQRKITDETVESKLETVTKEIQDVLVNAGQQNTTHPEVAALLPKLTDLEYNIKQTRNEFQSFKIDISADIDRLDEFMKGLPESIDISTVRMLRSRIEELENTVSTIVVQKKADEGIRIGRLQIGVAIFVAIITLILSLTCSAISIVLSLIQLYATDIISR